MFYFQLEHSLIQASSIIQTLAAWGESGCTPRCKITPGMQPHRLLSYVKEWIFGGLQNPLYLVRKLFTVSLWTRLICDWCVPKKKKKKRNPRRMREARALTLLGFPGTLHFSFLSSFGYLSVGGQYFQPVSKHPTPQFNLDKQSLCCYSTNSNLHYYNVQAYRAGIFFTQATKLALCKNRSSI